jgi:RHS repeat-associated protein
MRRLNCIQSVVRLVLCSLSVAAAILIPCLAQDVKEKASQEMDASQHLDGGQAPYRMVGQSPPPGNPPNRFVYFHLDHLGSPRLILDESGATVSMHHYLPFGEELPAPASPDPTMNRKAFTGHERDTESGLDYMMARYYSSNLGRFMAVDPSRASVDTSDPQSWNRYAYVQDNPVALVDLDGKEARLGTGAAQTLATARQMVPQADRAAITSVRDKGGVTRLKVDNSHKSNDLNFKNLQKVANSPGVVEINQTAPGTQISMVHNGQPASASLSQVQRLGVTIPSAGTAGTSTVTSAQPGVTEIHVDSTLSPDQQAPVLAGEIAGHALPGLLGQGADPGPNAQHVHDWREKPAATQARNNRDQLPCP